MDRNQAKEFYPILQAFAEGMVIECRNKIKYHKSTYVPPPTRKERRKRERELKKKFPLDLTKFIKSHRT